MAKLTPQEAQQKHAQRLKAAIPDMKAGVNRVTVAPGQQAAAKSEKWINNLNDAAQSGKWARRVASVSVEEWKRQMIDKGTTRVASGIDGAAAKVTDFFSQLFPFQDSVVSQIKGMPDMTLEDNIARATAMIRGMANFKRK
jgi:hypothetical protein